MSDPVTYLRIAEESPLPDIRPYSPFRAVVVLDAAYTDDWQNKVSCWLVDSGCLYMMAWGDGCSSWDDSVDWAQIDKYPDGAPEAEFVMTTWHENETLIGVFSFAQSCAQDPFDLIKHSLIVHVGATDRESELLALYAQAAAWVEPEENGSN